MSWPSHENVAYMRLEEVEATSEPFSQICDLEDRKLDRVKLTNHVLGQGSYGTVYKAKYKGGPCAAKQLDLYVASHLPNEKEVKQELEHNFMLECLQHSKLSHPNIVKMLGVFYRGKTAFLVMELMEYNLTQMLENTHNIIMYVKLSILQDVSRGLCYLHAQNPPIIHQALYSDNILITKGLIAKIGDFKISRALLSIRWNRDSNDFLPNSFEYELPQNVFSFGCIVCHVITQIWPRSEQHYLVSTSNPSPKHRKRNRSSDSQPNEDDYMDYTDPKVTCMVEDWSVEKHQSYIAQIDDHDLKHLVEACLQCNPERRPKMSQIYNRITSIMISEFI